MRTTRVSLWRAPLQAIALQQQQARNALTTDSQERATLRTEEGAILECVPEPFSGGGATGAPASFVFRPGGPASPDPGVFTSPSALKAGLGTLDPATPKFVAIDTSFGAAHITAADSPWDLSNITFQGSEATPTPALRFDDGATLTPSTTGFTLDGVAAAYSAAAATCWTPARPTNIVKILRGGALTCSGAGAFADVGAAGANVSLFYFLESVATLGNGVHPVTVVEATGSAGAFLVASLLNANAFVHGAAPGGTLNIAIDGASQPLVSVAQDVANLTVTTNVLDPQPTFVFQPGGVAGGNVFTSWASLMAAVALSPGAKIIYVDDHLGAAHATPGAGAWNIDLCTFVPNYESLASGTGAGLIFDAGTTVTFNEITLDGGMAFTQPATATGPVFALAPGVFASVFLRGQVNAYTIAALGAHPWATIGNGAVLTVMLSDNTVLGDGVHAVINALAGGAANISCNCTAGAANISANAIGGAGTLVYSYVAGPPNAQTVTTQVPVYDGFANETQATGNSGTGTGTVTVTTGNIRKLKTGKMLVMASIAGVATSAATVTAQLVRDAAPNIGNTIVATALSAGDGFSIAINFIDTAPDANNHTYKLSVVASAGNLTVAANSAQIVVSEL